MDIVVIDCPAEWGMSSPGEWAASLGGGDMQLDLCTTSTTFSLTRIGKWAISIVKLFREKRIIDDPKNPVFFVGNGMGEPICVADDVSDQQ